MSSALDKGSGVFRSTSPDSEITMRMVQSFKHGIDAYIAEGKYTKLTRDLKSSPNYLTALSAEGYFDTKLIELLEMSDQAYKKVGFLSRYEDLAQFSFALTECGMKTPLVLCCRAFAALHEEDSRRDPRLIDARMAIIESQDPAHNGLHFHIQGQIARFEQKSPGIAEQFRQVVQYFEEKQKKSQENQTNISLEDASKKA